MAMGDAVDLLEHWQQHPPVDITMAAVHLKPGRQGYLPPAPAPQSEDEVMGSIMPLLPFTGPASRIPADLRAIIDAAEELKRKHKLRMN